MHNFGFLLFHFGYNFVRAGFGYPYCIMPDTRNKAKDGCADDHVETPEGVPPGLPPEHWMQYLEMNMKMKMELEKLRVEAEERARNHELEKEERDRNKELVGLLLK